MIYIYTYNIFDYNIFYNPPQNFLWCQEWPWTSDSSAFTLSVLGSQTCTNIPSLFGAGSLTQGFVFDRQARFQNLKEWVNSKGMM